jgi:hypothetical protein
MLLTILNHAKAVRLIASHRLEGVRVPQVLRDDESEPWTRHWLDVLMGPALRRYEQEQRAWNGRAARRPSGFANESSASILGGERRIRSSEGAAISLIFRASTPLRK